MIRLAVLSQTTSPLPAALERELAGIDGILHAGGLGPVRHLERLARIAPLVAVVGARDFLCYSGRYPELCELQLGGARVLITHLIGSPPRLLEPVRRRLENDPPDLLVHGQPAAPQIVWVGRSLIVCPGRASVGQAGPDGAGGSYALVEIDGPGALRARIRALDPPPRPRPIGWRWGLAGAAARLHGAAALLDGSRVGPDAES
ncbi:MAG: metallophosphoesterase family protein [Acidobacteriota bacterium]|nr:MAG: metallophosphoesterase family protein [Acidobacteriota bacterium]